MPTYREGQINQVGLTNPGVYVIENLPTPNINGVPTNVEGLVGVASWGPVGGISSYSDPDSCNAIHGPPQDRPGDIATYVAAACTQGRAISFKSSRVSDGTDTAATFTDSGGTFTARYTGSLGNKISVTYQPTPAANSFAAVVNFPGRNPERFDNIAQALQSVTVSAGSGYTSVPAIAVSVPQLGNGSVQAVVQPTLKAITAVLAAGGAGYAVGDKITLANGVVLTVATVTSGAVATTTIFNAGSLSAGSVPTNPVAQTSATGAGTGATFTLTWGLGAPTIVKAGYGYTAAPTLTLTGGGATTPGTYTGVASFWAALAYAINNGTSQRGSSDYVLFTPSTSTASPTLATPVTLSGGTDGASNVTPAMMLGTDIHPRTGLFALRNAGLDCFTLCDVTDSTTWAAQLSYAIQENCLPIYSRPVSDSIDAAVTARAQSGVDDPQAWLMVGDYATFFDTANGVSRLISPAAFAIGLCGNLSPEQSPINKPLIGVVSTQTSMTGVVTSDAEESNAQTGGVDFIGRSEALGATFFSFMTGRNMSSNSAANGIEYTRLTNFLKRSLEGPATRAIVGRLQSLLRQDDPTRTLAKQQLDSFFAGLKNPASGSGGYGLIDDFATYCGLNENPPDLIKLGYLQAVVMVRYLNVVRYFLVRLNGGGNINITVSNDFPTYQLQQQAA